MAGNVMMISRGDQLIAGEFHWLMNLCIGETSCSRLLQKFRNENGVVWGVPSIAARCSWHEWAVKKLPSFKPNIHGEPLSQHQLGFHLVQSSSHQIWSIHFMFIYISKDYWLKIIQFCVNLHTIWSPANRLHQNLAPIIMLFWKEPHLPHTMGCPSLIFGGNRIIAHISTLNHNINLFPPYDPHFDGQIMLNQNFLAVDIHHSCTNPF